MSVFGNANLNRIYIHSAMVFVAETAAGGFILAYLLKTGLALHWALASITAIGALRFMLRQLVLPTVLRLGLRTCLLIGLGVLAASYIVLSHVKGLSVLLLIWIFLNAFSSAFYWPCYHAYVALLGDADKRGAQMSMKEALNTIAGIIGPMVAGLLLTFTTPFFAFGAFALILMASVIPLLKVDDQHVQHQVVLDQQQAHAGRNFFVTDGMLAGSSFIWFAAIFTTLGSSYLNFGGLLALASIVGIISTLLIGRLMDRQHAKPTLFWVYLATGLALLLNSIAYSSITGVLVASIVVAVIGPIHYPVMMTPLYNLAKKSTCPLRFHVVSESGWDFGCAFACGIAAITSYAGLSLTWSLLLGPLGCILGYLMLTRDKTFAVA